MVTFEEVKRDTEENARANGYFLNTDENFLNDILNGLKTNEERFGYRACPCRVASGNFELDRDIICPCEYRDQDVEEYGSCYCALYIRKDLFEGKTPIKPIPERRDPSKVSKAMEYAMGGGTPTSEGAKKADEKEELVPIGEGRMRFWYCKQCGYVVYREEPPYKCPICKAKKEAFAPLHLSVSIKG